MACILRLTAIGAVGGAEDLGGADEHGAARVVPAAQRAVVLEGELVRELAGRGVATADDLWLPLDGGAEGVLGTSLN